MKTFLSPEKYQHFINRRQKAPEHYFDKPRGLWYQLDDSWRQWLVCNMPEWCAHVQFEYGINTNENVLCIKNARDFYKLESQYGVTLGTYGELGINWKALSSRWAGIEISPYLEEQRPVRWYNLWDVSSGCIWHEDGIDSIWSKEFRPFPSNLILDSVEDFDDPSILANETSKEY